MTPRSTGKDSRRRRLKKLATLAGVTAFLLAAPAAGAVPRGPTPELIQRDQDSGKLSRDRANLYRAYAIGARDKLPTAYRSDAPWDGTLTLLHLRQALRTMQRGRTRDTIEALVEPASSSASCSSSTGTLANTTESSHFFVAYGTVGGGLSITSYVNSLEGAWTKEVDTFGWAAPPVYTTNPPPNDKYHVRIDSLSPGLYGFVSPSGTYAGPVGNNPSTSWNEGDAYASCMVLNRDYSGFPSPPQASLDSTTGHEFNHSIQFGYGALTGPNTPDDVFVEGGATWMEDEVYDGANDNYNYLWPVFADSMGDYDNSPYPYWITLRGFTERYGTGTAGGGEQVMQDFWEETSKNTGDNLTAMQTALANRGTNLGDAFHNYAIAVKFNKPCTGGYNDLGHHCFEEGAAYVGAAGSTSAHKTISGAGGSASGKIEDNYAIQWVQLPLSGGPYDVTLSNTSSGGSAGGQLRGTVVCDTGSALTLSALPAVVGSGASTTLNGFAPSGCTQAVAVITNQSQTAANPTSSSQRNYSLSTTGAGSPPPPDTTPPETTIDSGPSGTTSDSTPTFGFSSSEGGSTFECSVDSGAFFPCVSPHTTSPLADGPHTFAVRATDSAGNTDPTSATRSFTVDTSGGGGGGGGSGGTGGTGGTTTTTTPITTTTLLPATTTLDTIDPVLGTPRLSSSVFRAARSGASIAVAIGTKVTYSLTEAATTTFRVERAAPGRKVGGRCVRPTSRNRNRPRCTRYVRLRGSFTDRGNAGSNSFKFTGRLAGRALKPGSYRLVGVARDAAGNLSALKRARFRLVR